MGRYTARVWHHIRDGWNGNQVGSNLCEGARELGEEKEISVESEDSGERWRDYYIYVCVCLMKYFKQSLPKPLHITPATTQTTSLDKCYAYHGSVPPSLSLHPLYTFTHMFVVNYSNSNNPSNHPRPQH